MNETWISLADIQSNCLKKNVESARQFQPQLLNKVYPYRENISEYSIYRLGDQQFACRHQMDDSLFEIYPMKGFHQYLKKLYERTRVFLNRGIDLIFIAGTGFGYLLSHLEQDYRGNLAKGFVVVENRPELIWAQWMLFDCTHLLESNQVYWAISLFIQPELDALIDHEAFFLIPEQKTFIVPERNMMGKERNEFQAISRWFSGFRKQKMESFQPQQIHFSQRMQQSPDLEQGCIWSVATPLAYAHTPLMRSLMMGFKQLGWKAQLLELHDAFSTRFKVNRDLFESAPDLIATINNTAATFLSDRIQRPRISWFLDNPKYFKSESFIEELNIMDHIFFCDRTYGTEFENLPIASHQFFPSFSILNDVGAPREEFRAPIMFVGNYHDLGPFFKGLNSSQKEHVVELLHSNIQDPTRDIHQLMIDLKTPESVAGHLQQQAQTFVSTISRPIDPSVHLEYFIYAMANGYKRQTYVSALLDRGIVVYGPESWLTLLGEKHAHQYRGWLPSEHLADAYVSAKVCLNIHSLQCPTSLNPRDFDILAARACLITDEVEDIHHGYLNPGEDLMVFKTVEALVEQIDELLESPQKREELIQHGHQTYLQHHTPEKRAQKMLECIRG